ncbi:MAG: aspartate aminotransferase family protein [Fimbriimonadaceae bacterium]|nr:aspartate aminotransferase family protein [Fimbriimonadaceae bacterium]
MARLLSFAGFGVEVRAEGCSVWDSEGTGYLDFLGGFGVFSLGHRHPRVLDAVRRQLEAMPLSCKTFFNPVMAEAAERLAGVAPEGLEYVFFSNSGAESVEAALKFARAATGRPGIVATEGGYHGKTLGALSATGREKYQSAFRPLVPGFAHVPYGDLAAARAAVGPETAAFIVEAVQGEGGIIVPPEGYLAGLREACDTAGALLILDEVQTGLGRTGAMWGCDHEGVRPDILTSAKALGGGVMPIGATLGTHAVWDRVFGENPFLHTSTFGGNPMACAAAVATLEVLRDEGLVERSAQLGAVLMDGLRSEALPLDLVSDVRGRGLMVGVELAMDEVGELLVAQLLKRGVIVAYTLNNPRVIRLEPPLVVSEDQVGRAVAALREAVLETQELLAGVV